MDLQRRNNVHLTANNGRTLVFAHGFGCDKNMWRFLTPAFTPTHRAVLFDHVGSGNSDIAAYNVIKYNSLHGYSDYLVEVIKEITGHCPHRSEPRQRIDAIGAFLRSLDG